MAKAEKRCRFWLVWAPTEGAPTRRHKSRGSAGMEAERLARMNPETEFFVLETIGGAIAQSRVTGLKIVDDPDGEIPF